MREGGSDKPFTSLQREVFDLIRRKRSFTRKEIEKELGVSLVMVSVILRELKEAGLIVGEGNTRGMVYLAHEMK